MGLIKPIHYGEIIVYIGKRVKMILDKNIIIDTIYSAISDKKETQSLNSIRTGEKSSGLSQERLVVHKIKIEIYFIFMKNKYKFINIYMFYDLDALIDLIVSDVESKINKINLRPVVKNKANNQYF
jgi:hypothetical protein